jgi:hypothetical protein
MHVEEFGLKQCEEIMSGEIHNWIRWARQRNYLPASTKCVLGSVYVPEMDDEETGDVKPLPPIESDAELFESIIVSLPVRLRRAFVLHHLNRGHEGQVTVRVKGRNDKARVLGVGARQYHYILIAAHNLVLRKWRLATGFETE